jgi:phosphate transport system protein
MFERLFGTGKPSILLEAAFRDITTMLEQSARMFDHSLAVLLDHAELEVDLDRLDDVVDEGERMVRRSVLEHLTVNPAKDLVASLVLVSMVPDAERIGDFARGLAEVASLAKSRREGPFADELRALAERVRPLFETSETAFREDDPEKARQVVAAHREIKADLIRFTRTIADSDLSADMALVYGGAARILRRISAHLSNISSTVVQPYDRIRHGDGDV